MSVAVRFAPSPTGLLHIGNIRAALNNWLFARQKGGSFMLRLDDTDRERSREDYAKAIERDLLWLGLNWDRFARQSDRMGRYDEVVALLKQAGLVYPCFETAEELSLKRKALLASGLPPLYDRAALKLTPEQISQKIAAGEKPHWRFKLTHAPIIWDDGVQGRKEFHGSSMSDPVIIREDGVPLYTFSSAIDDVDFAITHIIRGEDHVANTAVQVQIIEAVIKVTGAAVSVPQFAHFPLLTSASGEEMSKRLGTLSIASIRDEMGLEPMAINSLLARVGTSEPVEAVNTLQKLVPSHGLDKISRSPAKFDMDDIKRLNAKILQDTDYAEVAPRLAAMGLSRADEAFWQVVRPVIHTLVEARDWYNVLYAELTPVMADANITTAAAEVWPQLWLDGAWQNVVQAVSSKTGIKGKPLFMALRQALTGRTDGPELPKFLPLLSADVAKKRLLGQKA